MVRATAQGTSSTGSRHRHRPGDQPLRLCFAGTPAFAAAHLRALLASPHELAAVFTQPDRPAGRGRRLRPSAVAEVAEEHGLPVHKPASLRGDAAAGLLASYQPDALIVAAYGLILPSSILAVPRFGCINVHASLLPRWRGAAPVERALLAGDRESGVSIMQMDQGLDTGPILYQSAFPIAGEDDRNTLEARLTDTGCRALLHSLQSLPELLAKGRRQDDSLATYAHKLEKSHALIDWTADAALISRQVRAGIGRMPAFTFAGPRRIRILRAAAEGCRKSGPPGLIVEFGNSGLLVLCGRDALRVATVQLPGKNPVATGELLHSQSAPFASGDVLRSEATGEAS